MAGKDATLMYRVNQQLERLRKHRDSAYMDVVDRAMEKGRLEEVLVRANMPLALKGKIVQDLKKRGRLQAGWWKSWIYTRRCILRIMCIIFIITRTCGGNRLTRYIRMKLKGNG